MLQLIFVLICSRDASREIKYTMVSLDGAMDCDSTVVTVAQACVTIKDDYHSTSYDENRLKGLEVLMIEKVILQHLV